MPKLSFGVRGIGPELKRQREKRKESIQHVVNETGLSFGAIANLEEEKTLNPSFAFVSILAAHYGINEFPNAELIEL